MRILIADDDDSNRLVLRRLLEKLGHEIVECADGTSAAAALEAEDAPPLAFLDWMMPGLTGVEVCRHVRENRHLKRQPHLVLLTVRGEKEDILEGLRAGADDYMTKPVKLQDLHPRLEYASRMARMAELLDEQRAKVLSSSRMAALGEMAGGMAHEINNPLTIITGRTLQLKTLIQSPGFDASKAVQYCEGIDRCVNRIAAIISGLRTFASGTKDEPFREMPVGALLDQAELLCRAKFPSKEVTLEFNASARDHVLFCQPSQMTAVMVELISNAFEAVGRQPQGPRWIKVSFQEGEAREELSVTDSGAPIPQSIRSQLMQPFFTTKPVGAGPGLGLSTAQGIISAHGGELFLDQAFEHTRFVVRLPRKEAARLAG